MQSKKKRISEGPDMHDDILSLKKTSQIYDIWGRLVRNKSAMIMNFVFAGIGIVALDVLIWLTTTSYDASYISLVVFACAVELGKALG